jgi:hypothetical protein
VMEGLIHYVREELRCKHGILDVRKVLKMIDTDEARWLLSNSNLDEDTPISNYYRWVILMDRSALKRSEDSGFLPAMAVSSNESMVEIAANAGEMDALYLMRKKMFSLAKKGHPNAMFDVLLMHALSPIESAIFTGRRILLTGREITTHFLKDTNQQFWFGRELSLYSEYWVQGHVPKQPHMDYIVVYTVISNRARRAALQMVVVLKPVIGRDAAVMVGKIVYKTREVECKLWWNGKG